MAQISTDLHVIIMRYREQVEQLGIRCDKILLYGSYAAGTAREGSDIDLVVISKDWERFSTRERLELLGVAAARILTPVQAVGFTPQEIENEVPLPFWQDIIRQAQHAA
jgi:predicted nucleotidyltransferase